MLCSLLVPVLYLILGYEVKQSKLSFILDPGYSEINTCSLGRTGLDPLKCLVMDNEH